MNASLLIPLEVYPWSILQACAQEFPNLRLAEAADHQARVEGESLAEFLNLALECAAREGSS
ncbi:MAG: hypothetical protein KIS61_11455 [Candidatus Eremiobacteraeota bacterium]|nr:hypothetical protein [Candidatus Eremiobacteraeota bacterium]